MAQHGFYASFNDRKYRQSAGVHPFMHYSLADLLEHKPLADLNVLIAAHRSSAIWFSHRNARVTISRYWHSRLNPDIARTGIVILQIPHALGSQQISEPTETAVHGEIIVFVDDDHHALGREETHKFLPACRHAGAVPDQNIRRISGVVHQIADLRREIMSAELYYTRDNVLDI